MDSNANTKAVLVFLQHLTKLEQTPVAAPQRATRGVMGLRIKVCPSEGDLNEAPAGHPAPVNHNEVAVHNMNGARVGDLAAIEFIDIPIDNLNEDQVVPAAIELNDTPTAIELNDIPIDNLNEDQVVRWN